MEKYRILVINPGSTSTKSALFENEECLFDDDIFHDSSFLKTLGTINDQLDYRMEVLDQCIKDHGYTLDGISAVMARGGGCYSVEGGVYHIDDKLIDDTVHARGGLYHASMLGVQMAKRVHDVYGGEMYMMDPPVVDEYQDLARITGVKGIYRRSVCHALNLKAAARKYAAQVHKRYEDLNLIVCHIDGGISITAHKRGKMIDGNDAGGGQGPFTPTRMGSMAVTDVLRYLFDKDPAEIRSLCSQTGGLSSWFGTSSSDALHARIEAGDTEVKLIFDAMIYQVTKSIGSMAAVLHGDVDAIVLTGGLMRFKEVEEMIIEACGFIAPVYSYPGEFEMETLAHSALEVLTGTLTAKKYPGHPVFEGFDFTNDTK